MDDTIRKLRHAQSLLPRQALDISKIKTVKDGDDPIGDLNGAIRTMLDVLVIQEHWRERATVAYLVLGLLLGGVLCAIALETAVFVCVIAQHAR